MRSRLRTELSARQAALPSNEAVLIPYRPVKRPMQKSGQTFGTRSASLQSNRVVVPQCNRVEQRVSEFRRALSTTARRDPGYALAFLAPEVAKILINAFARTTPA